MPVPAIQVVVSQPQPVVVIQQQEQATQEPKQKRRLKLHVSPPDKLLQIISNNLKKRKLELASIKMYNDDNLQEVYRIGGDNIEVMAKVLGPFKKSLDYNYILKNSDGTFEVLPLTKIEKVISSDKIELPSEFEEIVYPHYVDLISKGYPLKKYHKRYLLSRNFMLKEFLNSFNL